MTYLRIYVEYIKVSVMSSISYRVNFILNAVITVLSNAVVPLLTILIYGAGLSFMGWSFYEALLIQAVFTLSKAVGSMLFFNIVWNVMYSIVNGNFELILIKPRRTVFLLSASSFDPESFGLVVGGLALFLFSLWHLPTVTVFAWLQFLFLFLMGLTVILGFVLFMAATAFVWVGNSRIMEMFESVSTFGRYPGSIFPRTVINTITYIVPVAALGFLPASALLQKTSLPMLLSAVPCLLFLTVGVLCFNKMLHNYSSAGG